MHTHEHVQTLVTDSTSSTQGCATRSMRSSQVSAPSAPGTAAWNKQLLGQEAGYGFCRPVSKHRSSICCLEPPEVLKDCVCGAMQAALERAR